MITIINKRNASKLEGKDSVIIDVTSKSSDEFIKFSPFYPHGNIPIPHSPEHFSQTVEGVWQGLKYIDNKGIDENKFHITNMKNIKRKGKVLGHQNGIFSNQLLSYVEARKCIYIPTYNWVIDHKVKKLFTKLYELSLNNNIILLDYNINESIENISTPISHAAIIKKRIEDLN